MKTTQDLKRFKCSFLGKHKGAIGIFQNFSGVEVWADNKYEAGLRIYDTHEHINGFRAEQVSPDEKFEATETPAINP